jgi:pilus assembly protein CpaB
MRPKSLILLSLALGCGLVASLGINQVMSKGSPVAQASTEKITVIVAKKEINLNDLITAEVLTTKQFPKDAVHKDALTKLDDVKGRRARQKIFVDRPILNTELLDKGQNARGSEHIPPGMRTVGIKVDATATSGYLVRPGDHVDLMVYMRKNGSNNVNTTMIKTFLQNVKVFAVDNILTENPDGKGQKSIKTVTLLCTPEQAEIVTMASNLGKITLSMRSPTDDKSADISRPKYPGDVFGHDGVGEEESPKSDPLPVATAPALEKPAGKGWLDVLHQLTKTSVLQPAKKPFVMTIISGANVEEVELVEGSMVPKKRADAPSKEATTLPTSLPSPLALPKDSSMDDDEDEQKS